MLNRFSPPQILVGSFMLLILTGTILLLTPWASRTGSTEVINAFFTATSSVCVTGLVVKDTLTYWSPFGQFVILILIQFGGLGLMSFATFYALLFGKKIQLRQRLLMQEALNKTSLEGIVGVFKTLLIVTFAFEFIAAAMIALHLHIRYAYSPLKALWYGLFHAISAFNNAGFDLFGNFSSLTSFTTDYVLNLLIALLIIAGGLGFVVLNELLSYRKNRKLSLHSRLVLLITVILILFPALLIFITEYHHALQDLNMGGKLLASFFQAVTPRTAGFNSLDMTSVYASTQFLIILLMFVGGSPGSTAGGIKTSTLALMGLMVINQIKGRKTVSVFERQIDNDSVLRAFTITTLAGTYVAVVTLLMCLTQRADFMTVLFEVVSAMGTVGLSLGLTLKLNLIGKILIILTMFIGRVGPLTLMMALAHRKEPPAISYPEDKIMLG